MIAVISADLLSSSNYSKKFMEQVLNVLKSEFNEIEKLNKSTAPNFKIFRGDSFQGILEDPSESLKIAMQLKTAINRLQGEKNERSIEADLRCAIGIGTYDFKRESISESNGQAFQFSGRTLDSMKNSNRKTLLKTPVDNLDAEFDTSLYLFDTLADKWSTASAEVIYYLLKDLKENDIAAELGISQSAVNQRKKAAGWDAIARLLRRYKHVISQNFSNGK